MRISQRKNYFSAFNISTNHPFFRDKEEVIISFDEYGVCFSVPSIDDEDTVKIYKSGLKSFQMGLYSVDIREGVLTFDESESDEDFAYFNYTV